MNLMNFQFCPAKEPMDTTESMKSDTPQPSAKETSPQKEQVDNNIAGMSPLNVTSYSHLVYSILLCTMQSKQLIDIT